MNSANRRGFLKIAGAGAAAAGAASLTPAVVSKAVVDEQVSHASGTNPTPALPASAAGSMVAYIHDVSSGEIAVMIEGHEVLVTDHELVAKLAIAVHSGSTAAV